MSWKPIIGREYYEKLSGLIIFKNGIAIWENPPSTSLKRGDRAGAPNGSGHIIIGCTINKKIRRVLAHRLLWFMETGEVPGMLDHMDRNPSNNRMSNLREVTFEQNCRNRSPMSGRRFVGVSFDKVPRKWVTGIRIDGKRMYLGSFDTEEEAAKAYDDGCYFYGVEEHANLNFGRRENA